MNRKRLILAPIPFVLMILILFTITVLIYNISVSSNILNILIFSVVSFFGLVWVIYVISNSYVKILENEIIMPRKYTMGASFLLGLTFLFALFRKRESVKIKDIKSIDIIVGYNGSLESSHQPMTITMKDGTKNVYYMKLYSKRGVMWILRNLNEINPKINFSKSCKELISLKSPFKLTETEKQDFKNKKNTLFAVFGILALLVIGIIIVSQSGKVKTETFDIKSIGTGYNNNPELILYTEQGIEFRVDYYEQSTIYSEVNSFYTTLQNNPDLNKNVKITYIERLGIMRNIKSATLSNGQTFSLDYK